MTVKLTCYNSFAQTNLKIPYEKFMPTTKLEAQSPSSFLTLPASLQRDSSNNLSLSNLL